MTRNESRLAGAAIGLLIVIGFAFRSNRSGVDDEGGGRSSRSVARVEEPEVSSTSQSRVEATAPSRAVAPADSFVAPLDRASIVAEFKRLAKERKTPWWKIAQELSALTHSGNRAAVEACLDLLEDDGFDISHKADKLEEALADVADPMIYGRARDRVAALRVAGRTSWYEISGIASIVASHGGAAGASDLLGWLASDDPEFRSSVALAVKDVADHASASAYVDYLTKLGETESDRNVAIPMVEGICEWLLSDPSARATLEDFAANARVPLERRELAYQGIAARTWVTADFTRVSAMFSAAPDATDRLAMIGALRGGVGQLAKATPEYALAVSGLAEKALLDRDAAVRASALRALDSDEFDPPLRFRELLRTLGADESIDAQSRAVAARLLGRMS